MIGKYFFEIKGPGLEAAGFFKHFAIQPYKNR